MIVFKKPMLAEKADFAVQRYPVLGAPKLDGIRAIAMNGEGRSRSMKQFPNLYVRQWYAEHAEVLHGFDGELIVGDPTDPTVFSKTDSGITSIAGEPDFSYYVFDRWDSDRPYHERMANLPTDLPERVKLVKHELLDSEEAINVYEDRLLDLGYEGVILRDPNGPYKQGRSTVKEGYLLKVKRWQEAEGVIIGYEEQMHNGNVAVVNEIGRSKRSSHQANKVGKATLGAWVLRGLTAFEGIEFKVAGLTAKDAQDAWDHREQWVQEGRIVTYKYFAVGIKTKPRHPEFLRYRNPLDMNASD